MNDFDLTGNVAIVTGAAGLLGREHCRALADAGATVIAADLDERVAKRVAEELGLANGIGLDVANPGSVASLRDAVLQTHGTIDVLVNNAAVNDMVENPTLASELSRFEKYPLSLWKRVMDVNVTGVFLCCQHIAPVMANQGRGSIINIASTYGVVAPDQSIYRTPDGHQPFYKSAAYPTSKGALIMLTKFLATYYGDKGVRVNALSPGGVENTSCTTTRQKHHSVEWRHQRTTVGLSSFWQVRHRPTLPATICWLTADGRRGDFSSAIVYISFFQEQSCLSVQ
jgi:NAD(P)-dependent dehydrogenase (short-subunit alcohol dehydrogenase family)